MEEILSVKRKRFILTKLTLKLT